MVAEYKSFKRKFVENKGLHARFYGGYNALRLSKLS